MDAVFLVYNEFVSAISQRVVVAPLLPLRRGQRPRRGTPQAAAAQVDFKYEPGRRSVLDRLVPQAMAIKVYRALLESRGLRARRAHERDGERDQQRRRHDRPA